MRRQYIPNTQNLLHRKFNKLTAIGYAGREKRRNARGYIHRWLWKCDCGNFTFARNAEVKGGGTKSCGCESSRATISRRFTTHGACVGGRTPEYKVWLGIIARCTDPNLPRWMDYGGRGITMCARWRHSFENFLADMGKKPSKDHSIERKENDGNYEPGNCAWATRIEQARNTRRNRWLEFQGERLLISEWAHRTGIRRLTIKKRIDKLGWSVERALTIPISN